MFDIEKRDCDAMEQILSNANKTLDKTLRPSWSGISSPVVKHCKGVVLFSIIEGGLVLTGHDGSGVVMAHNEDGSWSPPSAMKVKGTGFGAAIGFDDKDAIAFIMDRPTMKVFESEQSGTLGVSLDLTAGPVGRATELQLDAGEQHAVGATYVYSFSKGLKLGAGLKLTGFHVKSEENERFYGKAATQKEILQGGVTIPDTSSSIGDLHAKLQMLAGGETKDDSEEQQK